MLVVSIATALKRGHTNASAYQFAQDVNARRRPDAPTEALRGFPRGLNGSRSTFALAMVRTALIALVALPAAAGANHYGGPYGNPYSNPYGYHGPHHSEPWRPTYQQLPSSTTQQVQELKQQRFQSCFNSNATIISLPYGC